MGNVIAEIDENGNRTEHEYDAANRRILTRNALNQVFRFEYDQDGNLIREIDALNRTTTHVYDSLDNRIETVFANGQRIQTEYDALGRVIAEIDEAGLRTEFVYDSKGNLTQVKQGTDVDGDTLATEDGATTTFTYDEQNNKTSQTDALGRTTRWRYDRLGRVIVRTLPNNLSESYSYDRVGNRTGRTPFDFALRENNTFDVNNRLIEADYTGANAVTETFQYDNVGNRISAANAEGTHTWEYDNRDRLIRETKPNGDEIEYAYDSAGNRTTVTTTVNTNGGGTTSRTETYEYDVLNRLARVIDEHNNITTYTYDAVGNRETMTFPNGNVTTYTYDQRNRLTAMSTANPSATLLERYNYTLHPTGRRTHIDELDGRRSQYQYDDLYRMTSETITDSQNGNHQADYQYDAVGNRTQSIINGVTTAYTYDVNDQLVSQGGETYTYDFNGSLRTHRIGFSTTTYTYNAKQQLIQVSKPGEQIHYTYDVDGNRISSVENSNTTDYLVDTNRDFAQVLNEKVNNAIEIHYVHGDDLISQDSASNIRYYHTDGLGSTRHLSDAGGSLTDSYDYAAFGELLNSTGASENRYLFTGEQFDSFTGNYYLRARDYNPRSGRLTQMDSFQGLEFDPVTLHKYLYVNADPVNFTDPSGNFGLSNIFAALNTVGTLFNFASTASDVGAGIGAFTGDDGLSLLDLGLIVGTAAIGGGAAFKIFKTIAKKRKIKNSTSKNERKRILSLGKFPKMSNGMSNKEVGALLRWGSNEKGAKDAIARGITRGDIKKIKDSKLSKKDIENLRDYYKGFQEVLDGTVRQGAKKTPMVRAELMELILKNFK